MLGRTSDAFQCGLEDSESAGGLAQVVGDAVRDVVRLEIEPRLDDFRRFVDRRIAELSAEVHGAVQLVDYSETNLSGQLGSIHEQIAKMVGMPQAETRTTGMELEAVIDSTESAANQIMEAAEAISTALNTAPGDPAALRTIAENVEKIFEACAFQDLAGQRVRRAIQHLQHAEHVLGALIDPSSEGKTEPVLPPTPTVFSTGHDLEQSEIDRLLNEVGF
jgi:chemotaxis protein CheZ